MIRLALACLALVSCLPSQAESPIAVLVRDGVPVCSAFAVGPRRVLTAAHCVTDRADVEIMTEGQWQHTVRGRSAAHVEYVDPARDIAALSTEQMFLAPVRMREPVIGETVYARSTLFAGMTDGNILPGAGYFLDTDMSIVLGWSGSPVFGLDGRVVGFVHSCVTVESAVSPRRQVCIPFSTQIGVLP